MVYACLLHLSSFFLSLQLLQIGRRASDGEGEGEFEEVEDSPAPFCNHRRAACMSSISVRRDMKHAEGSGWRPAGSAERATPLAFTLCLSFDLQDNLYRVREIKMVFNLTFLSVTNRGCRVKI